MIRWCFRILGAVLVALLGMAAISYMQKRFDDADQKRALLAFQAKVPEAQDCHTHVDSRTKGWIRIQCREQVWLVDIVRGVIQRDF